MFFNPPSNSPLQNCKWKEGTPTKVGVYWIWGYRHETAERTELMPAAVIKTTGTPMLIVDGAYNRALGRTWYTPATLPDFTVLPPAQLTPEEIKALRQIQQSRRQSKLSKEITQQLEEKGLLKDGKPTAKAKSML